MKNLVQQWAARIKPLTWTIKDSISLGHVVHMRNLLNEIVPGGPADNPHLYGYSFLFNTQTNNMMGSDGYDNYQAPVDYNGKEYFSRRMWAGGQLDFLSDTPKETLVVDCTERVSTVRFLRNNAFVLIERAFETSNLPFLKELRTLIYTNDPFQEIQESDKKTVNLYDRSTTTRFTLEHIMRYNFLTYNLHKIHYDKNYCRREGLQDVIVSGPFMVLILLHYFAAQYPERVIESFKYRNSRPCYIDKDVNLCIKEKEDGFNLELTCDNHILCSGTVIAART